MKWAKERRGGDEAGTLNAENSLRRLPERGSETLKSLLQHHSSKASILQRSVSSSTRDQTHALKPPCPRQRRRGSARSSAGTSHSLAPTHRSAQSARSAARILRDALNLRSKAQASDQMVSLQSGGTGSCLEPTSVTSSQVLNGSPAHIKIKA